MVFMVLPYQPEKRRLRARPSSISCAAWFDRLTGKRKILR
ncbi:unnamed protein product [Mycetohabitans rhizoxinica HKI 454]|uniref:Uncharacterized protein n=1 Tax=Mycetohabitans rhizoxinica (strain DSM 19002 / CIP 109453 / HKI 454) TaxID=882378 RepID=E5AMI3_MYCRK|nr:unnamed protein product [Mycetohabitans rhizoxinica HKI 454]